MDAKKLAFWQEAIGRQKESKLSISQWCKENGLAKGRFYYWNQRINKSWKSEITSEEQIFAKVEIPKSYSPAKEANSTSPNLKLLWNGLEIIISGKDDIPLVADLNKQLQEVC